MSKVGSDIEIAQAASKLPIAEIAGKLGIPAGDIIPYGNDKAKIGYDFLAGLQGKPDGKLILVTAISPTPAGEGKTTTTVGLGDGLNRIEEAFQVHGYYELRPVREALDYDYSYDELQIARAYLRSSHQDA